MFSDSESDIEQDVRIFIPNNHSDLIDALRLLRETQIATFHMDFLFPVRLSMNDDCFITYDIKDDRYSIVKSGAIRTTPPFFVYNLFSLSQIQQILDLTSGQIDKLMRRTKTRPSDFTNEPMMTYTHNPLCMMRNPSYYFY